MSTTGAAVAAASRAPVRAGAKAARAAARGVPGVPSRPGCVFSSCANGFVGGTPSALRAASASRARLGRGGLSVSARFVADAYEEVVLPPPDNDKMAIEQAQGAFKLVVEKEGGKGSKPGKRGGKRGGIMSQTGCKVAVELPFSDEKPTTMAKLAADFVAGLPKPVAVRFGDVKLAEAALKMGAFDDVDVISPDADEIPAGTELVVLFMAENSQVDTAIKLLSRAPVTAHVVALNCEFTPNPPKGNTGFISSFDVIYSYLPLNIQGLVSKRQGAVVKCYTGGPVRGTQWRIWTTVEKKTTCVGKTPKRPGPAELENALYMAAAAENPINKGIAAVKSKLPGGGGAGGFGGKK